jgi:hypothetical protein
LREEARAEGVIKRHVVSRPIPLEYLRLAPGDANSAPEMRRERSDLLGLRSGDARPVYPITFWHTSGRSSRRYTFYAPSEAQRKQWHAALTNATLLRKVSQESNMVGSMT